MTYFHLNIQFSPMIRGFLLLLGLYLTGCDGGSRRHQGQDEAASDSLLLQPSIAWVDSFSVDTIEQLDAYFEARARHGRFNGNVLLVDEGKRYERTLGKRNFKKERELEEEDAFQLASLSKPITAFGLLLLIDQGKLDLDDFVQDYLWDFPFENVTIRSLLAHTSGIGNYIYITDSLWNAPDSFMTNLDMYNFIGCGHLPRYYTPHTRFHYCNTNYALLPLLIEAVSGRSFRQYMQEEVFEPLGMVHTSYLDPWIKNSSEYAVLGHYPNGDPKRPFYLNGIVGDKGLYSTTGDLFKFFMEWKHPSLISKRLAEEAMCPQSKSAHDQYYGLGWRIRPLEDDTLIFHNGWWRGFRSYFWMSKKQEKVAIILTNSIRGGYLKQDELWQMF